METTIAPQVQDFISYVVIIMSASFNHYLLVEKPMKIFAEVQNTVMCSLFKVNVEAHNTTTVG